MRKIRRHKRKKQKKMVIILSLSLLMILTVGYAAFSTNLSITAKGNIKKYTVENYVKDNLFAMYDGIENTTSGHGTPTDTWYNKALDLNPSVATTAKSTLNNFTASSWTNDNGLEFNGTNNNIDTGYNQEVFGQEFTFSFVVDITEGNAYRGIYGYHVGSIDTDPFYGLGMQMNGTTGNFFYLGTSHLQNIIKIPLEKLLNKKQQYTVIYQGGVGVKLYINEELVGEDLYDSDIIPYPNVNFIIGQSFPSNNRYFKGTMYNFIIYKKILTEDEIKQNYRVNKQRYNLE